MLIPESRPLITLMFKEKNSLNKCTTLFNCSIVKKKYLISPIDNWSYHLLTVTPWFRLVETKHFAPHRHNKYLRFRFLDFIKYFLIF